MKNTLILALFGLLISPFAFGQYGTPDLNFDGDGRVTADMAFDDDGASTVMQMPDGRLLLAGMVDGPVSINFGLLMLQPDGSVDNSFGLNGRVVTDVGSMNAFTFDAGLTPDGKILQVGYGAFITSVEIILVQYHPNGALDQSFGTGGIHRVSAPGAQIAATCHAFQPDGKLLLGGILDDGDDKFMVMRLNTDGTVDNTFGTNGMATAMYGSTNNFAWDIAVQANGGIITAGVSENSGVDTYMVVSRFDSIGSHDLNFGTTGFAVIDYGSQDNTGISTLIQQDGKILVAGHANTGGFEFFTIARLNTDGTLDLTYGNLGMSYCTFTSYAYTTDMAMQTDGKVIICGRAHNGADYDFAMVRYDQNGDLDPTFGGVGRVITDFSTDGDQAQSVILQDDQLIVLAGSASNGTNTDFAAARYISGVDLSIGDVDAVIGSTLIYPNPVSDQRITLEYTLSEPQEMSVSLISMDGKLVGLLLPEQTRMAGDHSEQLSIPQGIPTGKYLVRIQTESGSVTIRIVVDQP